MHFSARKSYWAQLPKGSVAKLKGLTPIGRICQPVAEFSMLHWEWKHCWCLLTGLQMVGFLSLWDCGIGNPNDAVWVWKVWKRRVRMKNLIFVSYSSPETKMCNRNVLSSSASILFAICQLLQSENPWKSKDTQARTSFCSFHFSASQPVYKNLSS